jgi:small subunit ribosomal protein S27e
METRSKFLKVRCTDCGNEQVLFDSTNSKVSCTVCGSTLAVPRGGKADIKAEIIGRIDTDLIKSD